MESLLLHLPESREDTLSPKDIFNNLNDLEEEIATLRYKAMSLQEAMKWLQREKVPYLLCSRTTE